MTSEATSTALEDPLADLPDAEILRRRLRSALVRARSTAGLTQKATAGSLDWSVSKVVRIEQGTVPVAPSDVRVMLSLFGVDDPEEVTELVDLARAARDARSWAEYDDILSPTLRELIGQEASASALWKYEPSLIPGLFQTFAYTTALLEAMGFSPGAARRMAEVRSLRQKILEPDAQGPELHVVIGETALVRPAGGSKTMREQLQHLVTLSDHSRINLLFLPFSAGVHEGIGVPFTILQFDENGLDDVLYLEDAEKRTRSKEDADVVDSYRNRFTKLEELAEREGSAAKRIERISAKLYSPSD